VVVVAEFPPPLPLDPIPERTVSPLEVDRLIPPPVEFPDVVTVLPDELASTGFGSEFVWWLVFAWFAFVLIYFAAVQFARSAPTRRVRRTRASGGGSTPEVSPPLSNLLGK